MLPPSCWLIVQAKWSAVLLLTKNMMGRENAPNGPRGDASRDLLTVPPELSGGDLQDLQDYPAVRIPSQYSSRQDSYCQDACGPNSYVRMPS